MSVKKFFLLGLIFSSNNLLAFEPLASSAKPAQNAIESKLDNHAETPAKNDSKTVSTTNPLDGIDELINKSIKANKTPGLSIAIIKDGKIVHLKGYGVRTLGKPESVSENTVFAIGSVSKSFTAVALGMLLDKEKIKWDDPLAKYLNDFRLNNAYLSQETSIRDALSHRVGIERNELMWYGSPYSREEIIAKLRHIEPSVPFRTKMRYNNMMYMVAGEVISKVGQKQNWDDFVTEKIFSPLKMASANTSIKKLPKDGDVATPHDRIKGKMTPIDWRNIDNIGPAGSINASAKDMAEYVKFHLAKGKAHGQRLLKAETHEDLFTPQILMPKSNLLYNGETHSCAYGMGWMLSDYQGKQLVEHGGNIDGMTAQVGMLPSEKLGIVILANQDGSLLPMSLMYDVFDRYLNIPATDRSIACSYLDAINSIGLEKLSEPDEKTKVKDTKPSIALKKYTGNYQDKLHSKFAVKEKDGELSCEFNSFNMKLSHWHFDTFIGRDSKGVLPGILFTFVLNEEGKPTELRLKFNEEIKLPRIGDSK